MTDDWTRVDIRHLNPLNIMDPATFQNHIDIGGKNVTKWLYDRKISWSLSYKMHPMGPMGSEPVLLFEHEKDAALFIMRWC